MATKPAQGILELPFNWEFQPLVDYVNTLTQEEWLKWTMRQDLAREHTTTECIRAQWVPLEVPMFHPMMTQYHEPHYTEIVHRTKDLISNLCNFYNGQIYKILLTKLKAHTVIPAHIDWGFSLEVPHRVHIPIITDPDVLFGAGESTINMKVGKAYEINNSQMHWVANKSDINRVHMIIDVIEEKDIIC